ncbi:MAG TPA: phosphatidylinositol-specific phospholipase C1-like protein [Iamia sp.]|nr:phosphatidylinositol-specific phospholipase C1-like protein [Iamia sp.]
MSDVTMGRRLRRAALVAVLATGALAGVTGPTPAPAGAVTDPVHLNEIQVVGSHNSYHLAASPEETEVRRAFIGDGDDALQYAHAPLGEQFEEQKVRQIELDVFRDDEGGLYADPLLREAAGHGPYDAAMQQPGTKVLHAQDVDYRSTCLTLVACLEAVETWSDDHPNHLPIAILLELKDGPVGFPGPFVVPEDWDTPGMDALDEEILSVVPREEIITPDDIRGDAATLEEGVLSTGWPTLEDSRGKVMFLMDNEGGYRTDYLSGHPTLQDRVLFTNSTPGQDDAAFVKVNDSRGNVAHIQDLVADGYMVRTRSDADTVEAREGDVTARDAAFQSGAQWVSTDYPVGEYARRFGHGFVVEIPGGTIARCNPVNGPEGCVSAAIEPFPERVEGPYIEKIYQKVFWRASTNAERWFWARRLEMGASRISVTRALTRSRAIVNGPFILGPGLAYLDRELATPERQFWTDYLIGGRPYEHMVVGFIASDEFYDAAGATDVGFVHRLFERALLRPVDPASEAYFVNRLEAQANRWTIARQVLGSIESRRLLAANDVEYMLGRDATEAEVVHYAEVLRIGRDDRDIAAGVAATNEFHG